MGWKRSISGCVLGLAAAFAGLAAPMGQQVRTDKGIVEGSTDGAVDRYLGIPYARPPVGRLRWREPLPAKPWVGVRRAKDFSAACYQTDGRPFGPFTREFVDLGRVSEDCLYLNVWAPRAHVKPLPVYFYIHGGGFGSGSGSIAVYDGGGLARHGAVVVTINYRLGAFGFLAHPALTAESPLKSSGNYGILDAIAALKWVHANIAHFGGDPANVTIAGQSAGAAAVSDLLMSPLAKGLFQKASIQSGPALGIRGRTLAQAEQTGLATARRLGAPTLATLRGLPAAAVLAATVVEPPKDKPGGAPQIVMQPNVDGRVIAASPEQLETPFVSDVPIIAGYNRDEAFIFGTPKSTPASFASYVRDRYGDFADRFLDAYPHATEEEATRAMDDIGRDRYMAQLTIWADRRAASGRQPLYLYQFTHTYPSQDPARFGSFHTAEVPYVLGSVNIPGVKFTADDRQMADQMEARWIAFMRSGNPDVRTMPHWPEWRASPGRIMFLGLEPREDWSTSSAARFKLFKEFVASGGQLSLF